MTGKDPSAPRGPLVGLRVIEFSGLGPGPHCAMLLADQGAEVLRIARHGDPMIGLNPVIERGRSTLLVDLRDAEDIERVLAAVDRADVLIEGYRPGVMERLSLGPDRLMERNPRLIYGRMTGWGQTGPLAPTAGHDINFIAITGALAAIGTADRPPPPPLNLVGDYGGGSMFLAFGIMAALFERQRSGQGQVIDAAVVDGVASMMALFAGLEPQGLIDMSRGHNLLAGGAPFYRSYRCADGEDIAIGPLEPKFYNELIDRIGAPQDLKTAQDDCANWEERTEILAAIFLTQSRADWIALFDGSDACFAPILTQAEAPDHPHLMARETFVEIDGVRHPAPAPRFSRTAGAVRTATCSGEELLRHWLADRAIDMV